MNKLFAKDELKIVGLFYVERFFSHTVYFVPAFLVIFFKEMLSITQISMLFFALAISNFIFEIPTGAFADVFGRKTSTLLGYIMIGMLMPMFLLVDNFYMLLLLFFLWGLFGTFYSGAREAWTVDNLKYYNKKDLINTYYLKEHSIINFGLFLSGFLGAFIVAKLGLNAIWIFASLSWIVSFLLLLPIQEHKLTKEMKISFRKLYLQSKEGIQYSVQHKVLLFLLVASFFIMFRDSFDGPLIWQPFLQDLGVPVYFFGIIFSISTVLGSIAPFIAKPMLKVCKSEKIYLIVLLVAGMLLNFGVLFVDNVITGLVLMLSMLLLVDLSMPIENSFTQKFIPSKTRATITSFKSMIISLAHAVSYPIAGIVADTFGTQYTIVAGGLFLVPAIYCYSRIKTKK